MEHRHDCSNAKWSFRGVSLLLTISNPDLKKRINAFQAITIPPATIGRAVAFAIEQPANVDVNEIVVRPTAQPT
jgi:NADP-dependent 3-hydroxy acid dehydrogenase YdfG